VQSIRHATAWVALLSGICVAAPAGAEENPAFVEALQIMRDRELIDDAKQAELLGKNQAWEASHPSWFSRIEWSGDLRGRFENFWFRQDDFGVDTPDRNRLRYRFRLGARARVNEVVTAGFRLASGDGDLRSTNQTLGSGNDFAKDPIFIDLAYIQLDMPKRLLPEGMTLASTVGKQENPFRWKNGKDFMIFDGDITPEGVGVQVAGAVTDSFSLFGNAGYFIVDENSGGKDPHLIGLQGGFELSPTDCFDFGFRTSYYDWRSVDNPFLTRATALGSLITDTSDYQVIEFASYARISKFERVPILVYGHFAKNLAAENTLGGHQDIGWGVGAEVGDKKRYVMVGGGYYHVEANFSPSQFTDSDLFDGFTNREGFLVYLARELFPNTELNLTFFSGDAIEDGPAFDIGTLTGTGVTSAERYRLQTDLVVKF
jgi:Putative porin